MADAIYVNPGSRMFSDAGNREYSFNVDEGSQDLVITEVFTRKGYVNTGETNVHRIPLRNVNSVEVESSNWEGCKLHKTRETYKPRKFTDRMGIERTKLVSTGRGMQREGYTPDIHTSTEYFAPLFAGVGALAGGIGTFYMVSSSVSDDNPLLLIAPFLGSIAGAGVGGLVGSLIDMIPK
jgi:hypothetical protein